MSAFCWKPSPWIRSAVVKMAIGQMLAYLALPMVYPSLHSPLDCSNLTPDRLNLVSFEAGSVEQPSNKEPMHLGPGLDLIVDGRASEADLETCLGRRKWVEKDDGRCVQIAQYQGRAAEPLDLPNIGKRARKLTREKTAIVVDCRSAKTDALPVANNEDEELPPYIIEYFERTQQPRNEFDETPINQIPISEIFSDQMCDYESSRQNYVLLEGENDKQERQRLIVEANDHLGSQEISELNLQGKELKLAKNLLGMKHLGELSSWRPRGFFSAIVDIIRSVRTTLYRIRKLDDMCHPPLFENLMARKEAQTQAFELLENFWTERIFKAIAHKEARDGISEGMLGSSKALMRLALARISKRGGQAPACKTALSWIAFMFWSKNKLTQCAPDLSQKLGLLRRKENSLWQMLKHAFKVYHADQAISEALGAKMIHSRYQITCIAQFKLRHKMGASAVARSEDSDSEAGLASRLECRKRVWKNQDLSIQSAQQDQGLASEPLDPTHVEKRARKLIHRKPSCFLDSSSGQMVALSGTINQNVDIPRYIVEYFERTQRPRTGFDGTPVNRIPAYETICDQMSEYESSRQNYVVLLRENDPKERQLLILKANDLLGSQEISDLNLRGKELKLVTDLLGMKNLGDLSSWKPRAFFSAIVDIVRCVRTTLYRIRKLDDMCHPRLFNTVDERKDSQREAFDFLKNFWINHILKVIAHKEAKDKSVGQKPGGSQALMKLALMRISKRGGQAPSDKTALTWIAFTYWSIKNLPEFSPDLFQKLVLITKKEVGSSEMLSQAFKTYHADQAIAEALESKMMKSDYQITCINQFKLSHKKGFPGAARSDDSRSEASLGSCLEYQNRVGKNQDCSIQTAQQEESSAAEPLYSAHVLDNMAQELIHAEPALLWDFGSRNLAALPVANSKNQDIPPYIVRYLERTQKSRNGFDRYPVNQIPESEIICDRMCQYECSRKHYVVLPRENDIKERQRLIVEANDHLGAQEISDLNLQEKESNFVQDLLGVRHLDDLSCWKPRAFFSAVVDAIRSVRATLYRIRKFDDMCHPRLFDTDEERKQSQREAFDLLTNFWTNNVFKAIAHKEARDKLFEHELGSSKALMRLALVRISKRGGSAPSDKTALSWIAFMYWFMNNLPKLSPDLFQKLVPFKNKEVILSEILSQAFKIYHADQAIVDALESKMIDSHYQITCISQFKLRHHRKGGHAVAQRA